MSDGEVMYERTMPADEVARLAEYAREHDLRPAYFTDEAIVMDSPGSDADFLDDANPGVPMMYGGWDAIAEGHQGRHVYKVMFQAEAARLDAMWPGLLEVFPRMERSLDRWVETNSEGCSKWDGLLHVLEDLGVRAKDVAGAGDGGNDVPWLSRIGWPMSVSNARPEVVELARLHLGDHRDEVVAALLEDVVGGATRKVRGRWHRGYWIIDKYGWSFASSSCCSFWLSVSGAISSSGINSR